MAFLSDATDLVPGDTNGVRDVFVRDRGTGRTERVSVGPGGRQADDESFDLSISAGGSYVAFWSVATNLVPGDTNGWSDMFVRDLRAGTTRRVCVGPGERQADEGCEERPSVSAGGRVAFVSFATNLVPGDSNGAADVFVRGRPAP